MRFFRMRCRSLLMTAVLVVGAVCWSGCGDGGTNSGGGDNTGGNNTGGNNTDWWNNTGCGDNTGGNNTAGESNNCTSASTCKSAVMPDGKRWMTENLRINFYEGSRCYDKADSNCNKYGRLYTWETAMKACPNGWHLPSRAEWGELAKAAGGKGDYGTGGTGGAGKKLKAKSGWVCGGNGSDDFGFSALPGGGHYTYDEGAGNIGRWWTATESGEDYAYYRGMHYINSYVREDTEGKYQILSVRCVADE